MEPLTLEQQFARFCDAGDPLAMAEVFDRAAPELLSLARRLTPGGIAAEDLIQETFLAAIEHRESFDRSRLLLPWLVGILVRQAGSARRRARRALDPGRVVATQEAPPEADAEAREFQELVLEALSRLSKHDRAVLVPLLFDGQRAVSIARQLGARPDTIRMRIHRGLDRLRRLLPAGAALPGFLGFDSTWRRVRENVLQASAGSTSLSGAPTGAAAASFGLGAWSALALLLALSLAAAWRFTVQVQGPMRTVAGADHNVASSASSPLESTSSSTPLAAAGQAREALAAPATTDPVSVTARLTLQGHVAGLRIDERALTAITVRGLGPEPIALSASGMLAEDGSFEVDVSQIEELGARRLLVVVDHPAYLLSETRVELEPITRVERKVTAQISAGTIEMRAACAVRGRVVNRLGEAFAGASVGLFSTRPGSQDVLPVDSATTDGRGEYNLRTEAPGSYALIAFAAGMGPATGLLDLALGPADGGELRLALGLSIAGRVLAPEEWNLAGTLVRCEARVPAGERRMRLAQRRFVRNNDQFELATSLATCDASGRFEFTELGTQVSDITVERVAGAESLAADPAGSTLDFAESGLRAPRFDLELPLPWSIFEFQASPPIDPEFATRIEAGEVAIDVLPILGAAGGHKSGIRTRLRLDRFGRAALQLRPGTRCEALLVGCTSGGVAKRLLEVPSGGLRLSIPIEALAHAGRSALVLELLEGELAPGEWIGLGFLPPSDSADPSSPGTELEHALFERSAQIDASGRVSFDDLPVGPWRVRARVGGTYMRHFGSVLPQEFELELAPNASVTQRLPMERGGRARIVVRTETGAGLTATARLFDAAGKEHPLHLSALEPERAQELPGRLVLGVPNEFGPLRAGTWRLVLTSLWHEPLEVPFVVTVGEVCELDLRLTAR